METRMSMKPLVFAISMLAVTAVPAFAESYKWGALSLDTEKVEKEPYYGVGGAETEKEAGDIAVEDFADARQFQHFRALAKRQGGTVDQV